MTPNTEVETAVDETAEETSSTPTTPEVTFNNKPVGSLDWARPNPEDFDWENPGDVADNYASEERSRMENLYVQTMSTVNEHEILEGKVIGMSNKEVVINIGYKSDGLVPLSEFRHMPDMKVGDSVEVYVETQEDKNGQLILSHRKARALKSWERVNSSLENDEVIKGFVKCRTKGGLIVDVFGIEAFLPGSQIDVKPIRDYDVFVGKTMEFKVVKINQEFKNVVVSHKVLIEQELESQKLEIMSKLEKGQVLEGTVKNITSYGVFMDLGGVDGLLHITDISWGRISHPSEVLTLDEKINVVILDFDDEKKRIALGLKQLTPQPWDSLDTNLKVEDKVKGKVVVLADYGAFVEIIPGVEGLIHVSEMSWSQHLRSPQDFLSVGDEVEAVILTLDREERKMSLGLKQLTPDPWVEIASKYPVGSKHKAVTRNFTNFGVFVELEEGVDGLIHISDLSWTKKIKHPSEFTKVNEDIEVVVLEVDAENRRLSLGHKQLEDNPWDTYESIFIEGTIHKGTVGKVTDKGSVVELAHGVEGFAPYKHLKKENGSFAKADESLEFKILEFSKENRKIILSHSRIAEDIANVANASEHAEKVKEQAAVKKTAKKLKDSAEKTTFGDLSVLSNLKSELEDNEKQALKDKIAAWDKAQEEKDTVEPAAEEKTAPVEEPKAETPAPKEEKAAPKKEETADDVNIDDVLGAIGKADSSAKDDLKKINGIGPVYEKKLNELGLYTFAQLSKLDDKGIKTVETLTNFTGRIQKDDWIGQAKKLMNE
ncbi:MAG: 30S ribosomal protein S1 [Bacteroidia bacterium]|nr:30S ribosomal protein S1 [Bacteroidia bacterium]